MKVKIEPVTIFPGKAVYLTITGANIRKFSSSGSAIVLWSLLDNDNKALKSGSTVLSGSDYQGWNDDEPYLLNWLLAQLKLTAAA